MPVREQITVLLGDAKWVILACLVFSGLLLFPDQVQELYRIIYSQDPFLNWFDFFLLHAPVVLIGISVWFAAIHVVAATRLRIDKPTAPFEFCAAALPLVLGALPLIACARGLHNAIPAVLVGDEAATRLPGAIWGRMADHLKDVAAQLRIGAAAQEIAAAVLAIGGLALTAPMRNLADRLNKSHFGRLSGIFFSVASIGAVTALVHFVPVALPRLIGTFGIVALFAVCILAFVVNFTLLGIRSRLPLIAIPCFLVVAFALDSCNDNHTIRLREAPDQAALQQADREQAADAFKDWLARRPDRQNYAGDADEYPVYVVTAQGGGIYAAYQTAIFLARMQDICPAFRDHLFAISSVSGGSVGAAVFAAALNAYDHGLLELTQADVARQRARTTRTLDPCPAITRYRTLPRVPDTTIDPDTLDPCQAPAGPAARRRAFLSPDCAGPLERAVQSALSHDFLAPLVAAALFTDYTQRFLWFPIPAFDRARALEYALEQAGRDMMKPTATEAETAAQNAFAQSFLGLWSPDRSMPALLVNATDAASGRRFVIAPFRVTQPLQTDRKSATMEYRFWNTDLPAPDQARDLNLSTAAVISARFPWVTPAATTAYGKPGTPDEVIRLVDGGYVDNSGVETALDLKESIAGVAGQKDRKPKVRLSLIVLSGGGFPERKSFSFGDLMEPLRALLSTESSRAYVAIDRAGEDFPPYHVARISFGGEDLDVHAETLKKARLDNRFYKLPLGWSLSDDTRDIIEGQSGRYWECLPGDDFVQTQSGLADSDCVQMLIYYELNKALTSDSRMRVATQVAISNYLVRKETQDREAGGDENRIIACYQRAAGRTINLEQAGNMRALIRQWRDTYPDGRSVLPFVLGTAAFESADFRAREQSLMYTSVEQLQKAHATFQQMAPADVQQYVRRPEDLAEKLQGGRLGNGRGNGDAWRFRPRGLAYVQGRENYQALADNLGYAVLMDEPDLILIPDINARSFIYFYFKPGSMAALAAAVGSQDWKSALAIVEKDAHRQYDDKADQDITDRTAKFSTCIAEAGQTASAAAP